MARTPVEVRGPVTARAYTSPTLVLLAMDWAAGAKRADFLGFAIRRAPGFKRGEKQGFLFNKIGFFPPKRHGRPIPSNQAPFQKFHWWDSAISERDRGHTFIYTITPVCGTGPGDLNMLAESETLLRVTIPEFERD